MRKRELVEQAARATSLTRKQMNEAVDAVFATIAEALAAGEVVILRDFGRFYTYTPPPYRIRKVQSGDAYLVDGRPLPQFRSSAALRRRLREEA